ELEYCVRDSGARAIAYEEASAEAVGQSPACRALPGIVAGEGAGPGLTFADLLRDGAGVPGSGVPQAGADDISLMLYTSGTTGKPKGVPRRHRHERAAALAHVAQNTYRVGERTLGVMPLYHTMGVRSLLSMALVDGLFVCIPKYDPAAVLHAIQREAISTLYLVPTLYHDILGHEEFGRTDISSVEKIGFAGAPMNDALLKRLDEAFRPKL